MPVIVILAWAVWAISQFMDGLLTHRSDPVALVAEGGGIFLLMLGCVFAVVRHADRLAEILREPYGTLVLTMSSTTIEATLMLRVMHHGAQNPTLLRDTVFAVLMLSMNLMVGLALTAGAWRHREQSFKLRGALSFLQLIGSLCLLLLVLPNHTVSSQGATLATHQEAFLGLLSVVVYLLFLVLQTGRHRGYFDTSDESIADRAATAPGPRPNLARAGRSAFGLLSALLPVVLLSEELGGAISFGIEALDAPTALGGLVIAGLGLIPEGLGALRAATANRIQRSVNICLGSALSTIGLTVPTVLIAAAGLNLELVLGLDGTNSTLLQASLFVAVLTFVSGRANVLQGIIHLMLFLGYVMFILFP